MRSAWSTPSSPIAVMKACAAAACSSRRASGGMASRTISPWIGEAKLTCAGPVMRSRSRAKRLETTRVIWATLCFISAREDVGEDGLAEDGRGLEDGALARLEAADAAGDERAQRARHRGGARRGGRARRR